MAVCVSATAWLKVQLPSACTPSRADLAHLGTNHNARALPPTAAGPGPALLPHRRRRGGGAAEAAGGGGAGRGRALQRRRGRGWRAGRGGRRREAPPHRAGPGPLGLLWLLRLIDKPGGMCWPAPDTSLSSLPDLPAGRRAPACPSAGRFERSPHQACSAYLFLTLAFTPNLPLAFTLALLFNKQSSLTTLAYPLFPRLSLLTLAFLPAAPFGSSFDVPAPAGLIAFVQAQLAARPLPAVRSAYVWRERGLKIAVWSGLGAGLPTEGARSGCGVG